jgi:hypothetical protein
VVKSLVKWSILRFLFPALCVLSLAQSTFAQSEEKELRLVSPIGAMIRSAVLPGWGQFHAHSRLNGTLSFIGTGGLLVGAFMANRSFQDVYNTEYVPLAQKDLRSPEATFQYNRANQRYKLRQFFLFAAAGVWVYSLIDSYVGANLYNVKAKADQLIDDAKQIEKLGVEIEVTPTQLRMGVVRFF